MANGKQSFLEIYSTQRIKKEIQGICDSYSHPWDILAELLQNSVDSIRKWDRQYAEKEKKSHHIDIKIDKRTKSISIRDSGTGIDYDKLPALLAPNITDKDGDRELVGEKGVGLKFAIFSSNKFVLKTSSIKGSYTCFLNGARDWTRDSSDRKLDVESENVEQKQREPAETYTEIELEGVGDTAEQIFQYNFDELTYMLRTKTFVGYTGEIFKNQKLNIIVSLELTEETGKQVKKNVEFKYWLPTESLDKSKIADIDAYQKQAGELKDAGKVRLLRGRSMFSKSEINKQGKKYWYYSFFGVDRQVFKDIAKSINVYKEDEEEQLVSSGIFVSTRGMPTGIDIGIPKTGQMGFWAQFFILIEHDDFKFDIGRKTLTNKEKRIMREIAKEQFDKFTKLWEDYVSTSPGTSTHPAIKALNRNEHIESLKKLPSLGLSIIPFQKEPDEQEAAVVAIFHELLGCGAIKGYYGLRMAYKEAYDFWGTYKVAKSDVGRDMQTDFGNRSEIEVPIVVEFKYDAASVLDDVEHRKKEFDEIDLIVCWVADKSAFEREKIALEPLKPEEVFYHGSNYKLIWPDQKEKQLLILQQWVIDYKKTH